MVKHTVTTSSVWCLYFDSCLDSGHLYAETPWACLTDCIYSILFCIKKTVTWGFLNIKPEALFFVFYIFSLFPSSSGSAFSTLLTTAVILKGWSKEEGMGMSHCDFQRTSGNVWRQFGCHNLGVLMASSRQRPGIWLSILQCIAQSL